MTEGNQNSGMWIPAAGLLVVLYFLFDGNRRIDSTGYISHGAESIITVDSNWLVGESKSCKSFPINSALADAVGERSGYAFWYVKCDDGAAHKIHVEFWGERNQPENTAALWKCARGTDSFTCRQTGSENRGTDGSMPSDSNPKTFVLDAWKMEHPTAGIGETEMAIGIAKGQGLTVIDTQNSITVTDPNGKAHYFHDQAQADYFKQLVKRASNGY
jgi:hypothetical protein